MRCRITFSSTRSTMCAIDGYSWQSLIGVPAVHGGYVACARRLMTDQWYAYSDNSENYKYGCIFCAAIGSTTAEYEKFEHLLAHIMSKHKTPMMNAEIQAKTKCTTGGVAGRKQDWDVMLPDGNNKVTITAADELLMAASKMWSRRKSRNKK